MGGIENIFWIVGVFYTLKIILKVVFHIKDGFSMYVLPTIFGTRNFAEKYGKWAVVTGCTQGIGRYYAEEMAKRGLNIVLVSRSQSKLDDVAQQLRNKYGKTKIIIKCFKSSEYCVNYYSLLYGNKGSN